MPIEIRELIIKARVEPRDTTPGRAPRDDDKDCGCGATMDADALARILADMKER